MYSPYYLRRKRNRVLFSRLLLFVNVNITYARYVNANRVGSSSRLSKIFILLSLYTFI